MAISYTDQLRIALQGDGDNPDTWGQILNTSLSLLGDAIAGVEVINATGVGSKTLTTVDGAEDEARKAVLKITGILNQDFTITCPSLEKLYVIHNNTTSGDFDVNIKANGSSITLTVNRDSAKLIYCDGADLFDLNSDLPALLIANNLSDLSSPATALTNLGLTATATEINKLDGLTATTTELNKLDGLTASAGELNILDNATISTTELNKLDGLTPTTTELNYVDGVTAPIQDQLNTLAGSDSGIGSSLVQAWANFSITINSSTGTSVATTTIEGSSGIDSIEWVTSPVISTYNDGLRVRIKVTLSSAFDDTNYVVNNATDDQIDNITSGTTTDTYVSHPRIWLVTNNTTSTFTFYAYVDGPFSSSVPTTDSGFKVLVVGTPAS